MQIIQTQRCALCASRTRSIRLAAKSWLAWASDTTVYGRRFLLRVDEVAVCSVPLQWTDLAAPDPEIILGKQRALFRVADLLELARLVDDMRERKSLRKGQDV